jgi:DNA polymerase-3 subunit gamma/tau
MTALYRTYRPQRFDDVVGQEPVVRTLRNAITSDRVAHAYLLTGSRGTGKTTLAKLLAKAMNCEQGPTPDPCGVCESCVSIAEGRSMDVAEIDAASNRGIDAVRERIIDTVAFQPTMGTRRVYILDEAHQLTPEAFNALLKTIEEPPPHVLFVFCTTELHKMMATVRDRCQRFTLAPAGSEHLLGVLQRICADEGITADEAALRAVARAAQGSYRNALGLLEMLSTAFGSTFTHADVLAHLGAVSEEVLLEVSSGVLTGNVAAVITRIEQLVQEGGDVEQFGRELAEHFRMVLLVKNGMDPATLGAGSSNQLQEQAAGADEQRVISAIDCISDAVTRIRVGTDPRLAMETALVRACQGLGLPSLALRLARIEHGDRGTYGEPINTGAGAGAPPARPVQAAAPKAAAPQPVAPKAAAPQAPAAPAKPASPSQAVAAASAPTLDVAPEDIAAWWPAFVQRAAIGPLKSMFDTCSPIAVENGKLVIETAQGAMIGDGTKDKLRDLIEATIGTRLGIEFRVPGEAAPAGSVEPAAAPKASPVTEPVEDAAAGDGDSMELFRSTFDATEVPSGR